MILASSGPDLGTITEKSTVLAGIAKVLVQPVLLMETVTLAG